MHKKHQQAECNDFVTDELLKKPEIALVICSRLKAAAKLFKAHTGQTNADIAERLGISRSQISGYLYRSPVFNLKAHRVEAIARYLGAEADVILKRPSLFETFDWDSEEWQSAMQAANDRQIERDMDAVNDDDVAHVFGDDTLTEREQQASIDAMQSALQRQENHTVYAPIHLGSWLQLQKDLLDETPQAHLSAIAYSCVVRMSSFDRHKLKRIIDDLQVSEDLHG